MSKYEPDVNRIILELKKSIVRNAKSGIHSYKLTFHPNMTLSWLQIAQPKIEEEIKQIYPEIKISQGGSGSIYSYFLEFRWD